MSVGSTQDAATPLRAMHLVNARNAGTNAGARLFLDLRYGTLLRKMDSDGFGRSIPQLELNLASSETILRRKQNLPCDLRVLHACPFNPTCQSTTLTTSIRNNMVTQAKIDAVLRTCRRQQSLGLNLRQPPSPARLALHRARVQFENRKLRSLILLESVASTTA